MTGPLPGILAPLTLPASWLYGLAIGARNARFDRGRGVEAIGVPVISVGKEILICSFFGSTRKGHPTYSLSTLTLQLQIARSKAFKDTSRTALAASRLISARPANSKRSKSGSKWIL